jgi:hypothetical protein
MSTALTTDKTPALECGLRSQNWTDYNVLDPLVSRILVCDAEPVDLRRHETPHMVVIPGCTTATAAAFMEAHTAWKAFTRLDATVFVDPDHIRMLKVVGSVTTKASKDRPRFADPKCRDSNFARGQPVRSVEVSGAFECDTRVLDSTGTTTMVRILEKVRLAVLRSRRVPLYATTRIACDPAPDFVTEATQAHHECILLAQTFGPTLSALKRTKPELRLLNALVGATLYTLREHALVTDVTNGRIGLTARGLVVAHHAGRSLIL